MNEKISGLSIQKNGDLFTQRFWNGYSAKNEDVSLIGASVQKITAGERSRDKRVGIKEEGLMWTVFLMPQWTRHPER